jgi:Zn-dependent protease
MRSLYLGRAFGIPLYLHWTFVLLPLYVLYSSRAEPVPAILLAEAIVFSLFGCVLLHELGHALMARTFRIRTRDITLYPIGGVARLESTGRGAFQEVCIALAGPAVNLVLVFLLAPIVLATIFLSGSPQPVAAMAGDLGGPWGAVINYLALMCAGNVILLLFNLVPAFPMDGGRVLRALLSIPLGLIPATAVAAGIGSALAIGTAVAFFLSDGDSPLRKSPGLILVSGFVIFAGQMELAGLRRLEAYRKQEEQRRRERPPVEVLVRMGDPLDPSVPMRPIGTIEPIEPATRPGGFTGFLWDTEQKVWVRWEGGQRMDVF